MIRLNDIIDKVASYSELSDSDVDLIQRAYVYSAKVHSGQTRASGEPYLSHPLEVSSILADIKLDVPTIATGLLHDTVEDTLATIDEIEKLFGSDVAFLVDSTTKISRLNYVSRFNNRAENFRKLFLAMAKDIRVVLIKLADRLHNMRTIRYLDPSKVKSVSEETMTIYAPLAHRLGMNWLYTELEDLSFKYLNSYDYDEVHSFVSRKKKDWENYLHEVRSKLIEKLSEEGVEANVTGRFKHHYGIYTKMKMQNLKIDEVHDIIAFRIITSDEDDCYKVLGIVHGIWKPVPGKFKDYVALPKPNGYQSLHTTVLGPQNEQVEIQIKTQSMHEYAEHGFASHWKYKQKVNGNENQEVQEVYESLRRILGQQEIEDPTEFMESVRGELAFEVIYVFTPQSELIELPKGATPVDFAYAVHSEIGDTCSQALVNRQRTQLSHELKTGDTVEIITNKDKNPDPKWLSFVVTSKAKARIRSWLRKEENKKSEESGKNIIKRKLKKHGIEFDEMAQDKPLLDSALKTLELSSMEEVYRAVGFGNISADRVIKVIYPDIDIDSEERKSRIHGIFENISKAQLRKAVTVKGFSEVMVRFGKCCSPLPGELVSGFITRGKGVAVHKHYCPYLLDVDPQRRIDVQWNKEFEGQMPVAISVVYADIPKKLEKIQQELQRTGAKVIKVETQNFEVQDIRSIIEISVSSVDHLNSVMDSLRKIRSVMAVERVLNRA